MREISEATQLDVGVAWDGVAVAEDEDVKEADDPSVIDAVAVPENDDPNDGENETVCVLELVLVLAAVLVDVLDCDVEYVFELD
jgi:hypothetical protein